MKNVFVDVEDIHYAFGEDGTLKNAEITIMNRHDNRWKEVSLYTVLYTSCIIICRLTYLYIFIKFKKLTSL